MTDLEQFQAQIASHIEGFPLPEWLDTTCPICSKPVPRTEIMGMEVFFVAMFLGDLSFSYHCKSCQCAFIMHLKCKVKTLEDVMTVLNGKGNYPFVNRDELVSVGHHNLRSPDWNETEQAMRKARSK